MKKKFLSLVVILILLVSVSAVFGFFHNSLTGNSIFGKLFSRNIKPSVELTPGGASQIVNSCYGREYKLNTGDAISSAGASEVDADFKLLAVDGNEALFEFVGQTQSIDEGKNYNFNYGFKVWVEDVWENPAGDGVGYAVVTFCGEKPFCSSGNSGPKFVISTGDTVYVSREGQTIGVTPVAIDDNEVLLSIGGESVSINEEKNYRFTNGLEVIVDSVVETTNGEGITVIEVCDSSLPSVASTKKSTPKLPTTKPSTDLTQVAFPTSTEGSQQRCILVKYPTSYQYLDSNTLCASNDNRECVFAAEYKYYMDREIGSELYGSTTILGCDWKRSFDPNINPAAVDPTNRFYTTIGGRVATCCRFN